MGSKDEVMIIPALPAGCISMLLLNHKVIDPTLNLLFIWPNTLVSGGPFLEGI